MQIFGYTIIFSSSCNLFKSEESKRLEILNKELVRLNKSLKDKHLSIEKQDLFNDIFERKTKNSYSIIVYYDADCWTCFEELKIWKVWCFKYPHLSTLATPELLMLLNPLR